MAAAAAAAAAASVKKEGSFAGWLQRVRKTGEHSDVLVRIQGAEFRLHMLPLVNESTYFRNLKNGGASCSSVSSSSSSSDSGAPAAAAATTTAAAASTSYKQQQRHHRGGNSRRVVEIDDLPGGSDAFSVAADFCYIIRPSYTFRNVAPVRAAAEFLGMNDLTDSTKKFLYANVFCSWKTCVTFLKEFERVYPSVDEYVESRAIRVICAACTKAFLETKHVSVPLSFSLTTGNSSSKSSSTTWNSSPSHNLKDVLVSVACLPRIYANLLMDMLVDGDTNLNIKCRQSRNIREWLDYLIKAECSRSVEARLWIVLCFTRMLLKNCPKQRPWLELSSQYWCSLLEHVGLLQATVADKACLESLGRVKVELEYKIGASLHELDDYIQAYNFEPETLLSLVRHFMAEYGEDGSFQQGQAEAEAVASEVDGSLWGYAESGSISIDTFVALEEAFPCEMRTCHDMLFAAVERLLEKRKVDAEGVQRLWRPVDCSRLTPAAYDKAMRNPSYLCQPHVLECVLRRHSDELEHTTATTTTSSSDGQQQNLGAILHKVVRASLKLLEENSRRSKEILELQKQFSSLVNTGLKVHPSAEDSCENSPDALNGSVQTTVNVVPPVGAVAVPTALDNQHHHTRKNKEQQQNDSGHCSSGHCEIQEVVEV